MAKSAHSVEINHDKEPIRLFDSDFLEFFTHISPVAILVIWAPVALFFLLRAVLRMAPGDTWVPIVVGFVLGVVIWTFAEYMLHRYLFHYEPKTERTEKIFFLFHGVHHHQPQAKTRLVMPPVVSVPLALVFYGLFYLLIGVLLVAPAWIPPVFSGFIAGYLVYDIGHYAQHHFPMRKGYLKYIKRFHLQHHFKTPNDRFGVSSPVWDYVFGTIPTD